MTVEAFLIWTYQAQRADAMTAASSALSAERRLAWPRLSGDGVAACARNAALGGPIFGGGVSLALHPDAELCHAEVGELAEPSGAGRGGSSAMPHKRNPTGCQVALSAAIRAPGLVATLLTGMPQELERGLGGWQAEAPVLGDLFALAHGAVHAMRIVAEGLEVDAQAIAAHASAAPQATDRDAALAAAVRFVDEALATHDATFARRPDP